MVWIANLLLTIIASIWGLWVCVWGRAEWDSPFIKWFLICWNVKEKSGKVAWNEFLAIMKYLTLHYIQRLEADLLYEYESFVNMTPLYPNNHGRYSDEELEQLAYQLYGLQNEQNINHNNDEVAFHAASGGERLTETETKNNEQPTEDGVKCVHCGEIIEKDSSFCPYCGKSQLQEKKVEEPQADAKQEQMPSEQPVSDQPSKEKPTSILQKEETAAELKEKKKPKTWLWIVLAVLLAGVGAWYFLQSQDQEILPEREVEALIAEVPDSIYAEEEDVLEEEVTGYHSFLEQFYKKYEDETYLLSHITVNVKNKLKRDFDHDCPSDDCLATYVFTAYPAGADFDVEEGPIITATDEEGKFQVDFKYSGYDGEKKDYMTRTVFLTVTEIDGKYLISDYELKADTEQGQDELSGEQETNIKDVASSSQIHLRGNELSVRQLTEKDLEGMTPTDLMVLRNIVYARYGYMFKREDLRQFFLQFSWYQPAKEDSDRIYESFTETERYNVDFIKAHE